MVLSMDILFEEDGAVLGSAHCLQLCVNGVFRQNLCRPILNSPTLYSYI